VQSRPINLFNGLSQAWIDSGLVVTSSVGTVIEPRDLNRLFDELITKAGVAAFASTTCGAPAHPSCLRRTCQRKW
jgi:hypothetical protein